MKTTRYLAALLAAAQLAALMSCGSEPNVSSDDTTETSEGTTTEEVVKDPLDDDLPELDFGGKELHVRSVTYEEGSYLSIFDMEEITGDVVFDSLYNRNRRIEKRFNMKFVYDEDAYYTNYSLLKKVAMAGDPSYDLIACINRDAFSAGLEGQLMPMESLTYLDITKPYYSQDINEQLYINGKQLFAYSDECFQMFEAAIAVTFNKKITEDLGLDMPYELVKSGKWTIDKMGEYLIAGAADLNGDGEMKADEDRFGLITNLDMWYPNFWIAAGERSVISTDKGLVFNAPGNERFVDELIKCVNMNSDGKSVYLYTKEANIRNETMKLFKNGYAYFLCMSLGRYNYLRDMNDDYGLVPFPKYDESQEKYNSRVIDGYLHVVPISAADPEFASAIMEALASETAKNVFPAYYDKMLTQKVLRDEESIEMLEIIRENRIMDLGDVPFYESVRLKYQAPIKSGKTDIESISASLKTSVDKKLADVMEKLS